MAKPSRPYSGIQVILPTAGTIYSLGKLLTAIQDNVAVTGREVDIQFDPLAAANAGKHLFVGDELMVIPGGGTQRYGFVLGPGDTKLFRSGDALVVFVGSIYLAADVNNAVVNLSVMGR